MKMFYSVPAANPQDYTSGCLEVFQEAAKISSGTL